MSKELDPVRLKRQLGIVDAWEGNNGQGTLLAVTGFGKTLTLIKGAERCCNSTNAKEKRDVTVIVPNNNLKDEWEEELKDYDFPSQVYTIQTLIRRFSKENPLETSVLLPDEIHRYTSEQFGTLFEIVNFNFVFGASATIDTEDPKYNIVQEKCPIIAKVNLKEARSNDWVSSFKIFNLGIDLTEEEKAEYKAITDKFNKYFATFGWDFNLGMDCLSNDKVCKDHADFLGWDFQAVKVHAVQWSRLIQQRKLFLYELPSKISYAKEIISRFSDRIFITFSQSTDFAERLADEIGDEAVAYHSNLRTLIVDEKKKVVARAFKVNGKTKYRTEDGTDHTWKEIKKAFPDTKLTRLGKKRRRELALKKFKDKRYKIRVVSTAKALDEGANFPDISASIVTSGTSKTRQSIQRLGRMIRYQENKNAFQVEVYAKDTQDERWLRKRQQESINIKWIESIDDINIT